MCFFGGSSTPSMPQAPRVEPAPKPAPLPSPTPTKVEATEGAEQRRKRVAALRYGFLSTIKTSPQGAKKDKLGQ